MAPTDNTVTDVHERDAAARHSVARLVLLPRQGQLDLLDYEVPPQFADRIQPGVRVIVPIRTRYCMALVVEVNDSSEVASLRRIVAVVDDPHPVMDAVTLRLCSWLGRYYQGSLADAVATALPGPLQVRVRQQVSLANPGGMAGADAKLQETFQRIAPALPADLKTLRKMVRGLTPALLGELVSRGAIAVHERITAMPRSLRPGEILYRVRPGQPEPEGPAWQRREALKTLFRYLRDHPSGAATRDELEATFANAATKLRELLRLGLIRRDFLPQPAVAPPLSPPPTVPSTLNDEQRAALAQILTRLDRGFHAFLLWGVTGSGKTEVYLRAVAACLERGRSALVLVPEISLTHQLARQLHHRFGERVALLHSGLSDAERWREWQRIAAGEVRVVAGARSAVFAPLRDLRLIVVDEEHDAAYKQEEGLRYHGRDVAVMRAKLTKCPVLLASATPSLESFYNARTGRYELLHLRQRVEARRLPEVEVIDLRGQRSAQGALPLSKPLLLALRANLAQGQQSLLFLNRRGFARILQCVQCGASFSCPNCTVSLTYHRRGGALRCHYCNFTQPPPERCPQCQAATIAAWGAGTERLEQELRQLLPGARVARLDRDAVAHRGSLAQILAAWERRELDILVGTQMVTKGHDVHGVTLVGVLLADLSLHLPDFRSSERTFQLLTQVAGRAGRGMQPGRVIVQTLAPEHLSVRCAARHDFETFALAELEHRRAAGYPPFSRLVLMRCEAQRKEAAAQTAERLGVELRARAAEGVRVLGPTPAPIERLRGWYRWQLLVRSSRGLAARAIAAAACEAVRSRAWRQGVRLVIDVDPQSTL